MLSDRAAPLSSGPKKAAAGRPVEPFTLAILIAFGLGGLLAAKGSTEAGLVILSKVLVALLFFFQGVRLAPQALRSALLNLRLHFLVLSITFLLFPLLAWSAATLSRSLLLGPLLRGIIFLGVVPSTIQSSVLFTSLAGGNVAAAVCAASLSSVLGVILTPLLGHSFGAFVGTEMNFGGAVGTLTLQLIVPLALGQLARPKLLSFAEKRKPFLKGIDQASVILIVYLAAGRAFLSGSFGDLGLPRLALLALLLVALLAVVLSLANLLGKRLRLSREDRIAVLFAGSHKSLATGAPMAQVLVPPEELGLLLVPLLLYHQVQLLVCAALAQRLARTRSAIDADEHQNEVRDP